VADTQSLLRDKTSIDNLLYLCPYKKDITLTMLLTPDDSTVYNVKYIECIDIKLYCDVLYCVL